MERYIELCGVYAAVSASRPVYAYPILVIFLRSWDLMAIDFAGKINPPGKNSETYIYLVADYFTRFLVVTLITESTSEVVCIAWKPIINMFGYPEELYSDNTRYFTNPFIIKYFTAGGTRVLYPPVYNPWSAGFIK